MSRPVLFLDVDGVLNCRSSFVPGKSGYKLLDPDKIELLAEICEATECQIVMSSTWRMDNDFRERFTAQTKREWPFASTWRTPPDHIYRNGVYLAKIRGDEIAYWLGSNGHQGAYAIVDDDSDMLAEQRPFFVQTTFETGLQRSHADRLIAILNGEARLSELKEFNEANPIGGLDADRA